MCSRAPSTLFRCSCSVPKFMLSPATRKPEHVAIERQAGLRIAHHDGGVVDAPEQPVARRVPLGVALVRRELQQLERVAVGIPKIERPDAGGVGDGLGQQLRPVEAYCTLFRRRRAYALSMSLTTMATCWNQRSLLRESAGAGRPARRQVLGELKLLVAQPQAHDPHADAEDAFQLLVGAPRHLVVRQLLEVQHRGVERDRPVHVAHGEAHHRHRLGRTRGGAHRSAAAWAPRRGPVQGCGVCAASEAAPRRAAATS